jgi:hypothetical protein
LCFEQFVDDSLSDGRHLVDDNLVDDRSWERQTRCRFYETVSAVISIKIIKYPIKDYHYFRFYGPLVPLNQKIGL